MSVCGVANFHLNIAPAWLLQQNRPHAKFWFFTNWAGIQHLTNKTSANEVCSCKSVCLPCWAINLCLTSPEERAYSLKKSPNLTKPLEFVCNMFYGCFWPSSNLKKRIITIKYAGQIWPWGRWTLQWKENCKHEAVFVRVKEGRQVEFPFGWFIWEGYRKHSVGSILR